ncbi:MAG: D-alanyl-D-alanine carboxypeptidase, partial [Firmicutes bacterium]|nr:D-alanyl-D-alanine carboxypeptidase [Candidatus Scybalomonas excrementavium]
MKKFIIYILLLSMCLMDTIPTYAQTKVPKIDAKSAIVMDAQTGQILYGKSMKKVKYPASLTKLMTVLLTLENCKLNEKVTFSKEAVYGIEPGSSNIGILPGEILTVKQCLYGMMLESANEVCSAVAEHISGSVEQFSKLMTKRAKELGCENTQFKNANGLHHDEHYTTAYDMALILKEVLKYPEFRTIASARNYRLKKTNKQKGRWLGNHHKMIRYPTDGIYSLSPSLTPTSGKTAFTTKAKTCLATSATNGDMELICIVMEDTGISVYWDTKHLLEYFFNNYEH